MKPSSVGGVVPLLLTVAVAAVAARQPPVPEPRRLVCPRPQARFGRRPATHSLSRTLQGFLG